MLKIIPKLLSGIVLLIILQACTGVPAAEPTLDRNKIKTAIAATMGAASTQRAQLGIPITGGESATPTPTTMAATTPTGSVAAPPALTGLPSGVQITVSKSTNCRTGPGIAYSMVGALLVGQVSDVVGRNATSTYWIIRNPNRLGQVCWLWGKYAILTGNTTNLPVYAPPPLPTPTVTPTPVSTVTPVPTNLSPTAPAPSATPPAPSPTPAATNTP